ncbi:MAG: FkbM family methyltransferase, partial [Nitrososphaerota archaeon]|nr:FkbM family methyltransferase [Nitrososphaerota archaeon]
ANNVTGVVNVAAGVLTFPSASVALTAEGPISGVSITAESTITFDPGETTQLFRGRRMAGGEAKVRVRTLDSLVDELGLDGAVLKLDCEGDEYEVFRSASLRALGRFNEMCVELHATGDDVAPVRDKLAAAGFATEVKFNPVYGTSWLLYARRRPGV